MSLVKQKNYSHIQISTENVFFNVYDKKIGQMTIQLVESSQSKRIDFYQTPFQWMKRRHPISKELFFPDKNNFGFFSIVNKTLKSSTQATNYTKLDQINQRSKISNVRPRKKSLKTIFNSEVNSSISLSNSKQNEQSYIDQMTTNIFKQNPIDLNEDPSLFKQFLTDFTLKKYSMTTGGQPVIFYGIEIFNVKKLSRNANHDLQSEGEIGTYQELDYETDNQNVPKQRFSLIQMLRNRRTSQASSNQKLTVKTIQTSKQELQNKEQKQHNSSNHIHLQMPSTLLENKSESQKKNQNQNQIGESLNQVNKPKKNIKLGWVQRIQEKQRLIDEQKKAQQIQENTINNVVNDQKQQNVKDFISMKNIDYNEKEIDMQDFKQPKSHKIFSLDNSPKISALKNNLQVQKNEMDESSVMNSSQNMQKSQQSFFGKNKKSVSKNEMVLKGLKFLVDIGLKSLNHQQQRSSKALSKVLSQKKKARDSDDLKTQANKFGTNNNYEYSDYENENNGKRNINQLLQKIKNKQNGVNEEEDEEEQNLIDSQSYSSTGDKLSKLSSKFQYYNDFIKSESLTKSFLFVKFLKWAEFIFIICSTVILYLLVQHIFDKNYESIEKARIFNKVVSYYGSFQTIQYIYINVTLVSQDDISTYGFSDQTELNQYLTYNYNLLQQLGEYFYEYCQEASDNKYLIAELSTQKLSLINYETQSEDEYTVQQAFLYILNLMKIIINQELIKLSTDENYESVMEYEQNFLINFYYLEDFLEKKNDLYIQEQSDTQKSNSSLILTFLLIFNFVFIILFFLGLFFFKKFIYDLKITLSLIHSTNQDSIEQEILRINFIKDQIEQDERQKQL
ncbi:hypothetical protein PPERSA_08049 [Pseudocohnilembus persalinus]|uniref:Transmembrane protein n=1 Tax=Pseudocohnilembus persalinus TaxID=266149 RepID=A0A0V0R2K3_PSEPJ|nr:hypothetical protein PPERSA_08049 [Pseudocohnilembus persalinus]|eukprot:KRX08738.1 hypothetical protein PPERSA_08049 [Pseudocohnilembus persalinus]